MGWCEVKASDSEVGFHGTNTISSIGKAASHACVRLYPECARSMFDQVYEGMAVYSIYEPVKIAEQDGTYYLSVSPDIYGTGAVSLERVREKLRKAGILNLVDAGKVARVVERQDGYPWAVGEEEPPDVRVDGRSIDLPVDPVRREGIWLVPVAAVAKALGGDAKTTNGKMVIVSVNGRTLLITPESDEVLFEGKAIALDAAPEVVDGYTLAPLDALALLCNGRVSYHKGGPLQLETR